MSTSPSAHPAAQGGTQPGQPAAAPLLAAHGLTLAYDNGPAVLQDLDLSLRSGEILAVLGPSGVGKSSLLRVLAGLRKPARGRVELEGATLTRPHPQLAVAFQAPALLPWLTLEKNVAFGLDFKHQPDLGRAERQARVDQAIEEVGLTAARRLMPRELSGGMAQRAALARCLARQPKILFLDEPFGALDEVTRESMQDLLLKVVRDYQAAALLITHDIDEALRVADRIILLGGRPANTLGEWALDLPHPRDDLIAEQGVIRVQILSALRRAQHPGPPANTQEVTHHVA